MKQEDAPAKIAAQRVLADFEGVWTVTRRIVEATGAKARFDGQAVWHPDGTGLRYRETGTMQIAGHRPMHAERTYLWRDDLTVCFEDGRYFHRVPPRGGATDHWCEPDAYHVTYDFSDWPAFSVTWDVKGPRKAYRSESQYRRVP